MVYLWSFKLVKSYVIKKLSKFYFTGNHTVEMTNQCKRCLPIKEQEMLIKKYLHKYFWKITQSDRR